MNQNLRKKVPRLHSKKGMSLVELLVGVTIIAIVMASAAGAIVMGYKTTVDNAAENQAAANSASLNEVIMKAIKNCNFDDEDEANEYFFGIDDSHSTAQFNPNTNSANDSVFQAAQQMFSDVHYTDAGFPDDDYEVQYHLKLDAERTLQASGAANVTIAGVEITTAVATPDGFARIVSFLPYEDQ